MAYTFLVNASPANGTLAAYSLISTLITAGWTKVMDSDGTTYSSGGTQVSTGASGAGGLANTSAWVRLQAPAVNGGTVVDQTREITIQRGTTDLTWRIKYSASAGFTGGSPAGAVTPDATDEVFMAGGGTSASPTYLSWMPANATYRYHIACGGASEFYSFIAWSANNGTGVALNGLMLDVMATNSYPSSDVDPAVMYCSNNSSAFAINVFAGASASLSNVTNPTNSRAWMGATSAAGAATTSTNSQGVMLMAIGSNVIGGNVSLGTNPFSGYDGVLSTVYARSGTTSPLGLKGTSTIFRLGTVARSEMDTLDVSTSKDLVCVGTSKLWAPWNGSSPVI